MSPIIEPSEAAFQSAVLELACVNGWRYHHQYDARRSVAGVPDLLLVRPPRVLFIELKTSSGSTRPAQKEWLHDLGRCPGVETYLFRPEDWDRITRLLARSVSA